jgi:hypothetical protein
VWLEGLSELKNPMTLSGKQTPNLPACGIMPQPTTLPRAPQDRVIHFQSNVVLIFGAFPFFNFE